MQNKTASVFPVIETGGKVSEKSKISSSNFHKLLPLMVFSALLTLTSTANPAHYVL